MLDFVLGVIVICTGLCVLTFFALGIVVGMWCIESWNRKRASRYPLPPPDRAAERMYDQQYFDRAVGKKVE